MAYQIDLFEELPPGGKVVATKRKPCRRKFRPRGVQLSFELVERVRGVQDDDDPWVATPIVHRTVSAKGAAPLSVRAPSSVWDMAFTPVTLKRQAEPERRAITRVERVDGVVKCVRIMENETEDYRTRETNRRAKQKPPRPTSAFRRLSKDFQALVGK